MSRAAPSVFTRLGRAAFAPVDIATLVWFRVVFGATMLVEVWRYFAYGWVTRYFVEPTFHFKYFGFGWVQPWPGEGMKVHFFVLGVLALCVIFGLCYRLAATLFFLGFSYVFLLDQARYLNHFYLVCLFAFLMIFVPAHRAFSLDAWRRPAIRSGTCAAWTVWLLRAQLGVVFFFGGIAKLNPDWLQGEPMRMWLAKRADFPVIGPYLIEGWTPWFFSYGGLAFDLLIVPLLLWRRTRLWAFIPATAFNLTNAWIFQIGIFPWLTLGATVILFVPRLPRPARFLWETNPTEPPAADANGRRVGILALAGTYVALQILMPLRHWLYPGDVLWTEEGHRFSWRMKLRDKDSRLSLYAHDPESDQTWRVTLPNYLTRAQYDEASGRPDMILQLCHHVADDFRRLGHSKIQIRARVRTSLNGRPPELLIKPDVDLAAEPRTLRPVNWVTAHTFPLDQPWPRTDEPAAEGERATDNSLPAPASTPIR